MTTVPREARQLLHHRPNRPVTLAPEVAGVIGLLGVMLGMGGYLAGFLLAVIAGLAMIGAAIGFSVGLGARLLLAFSIWATATGLVGVSAALGEAGFYVTAPAIFCLLIIGLGQGVGLIAGVLVRRPSPD